MIRQARHRDIPAMEAFLAARADTSMFLRANLQRWQAEPGPAFCSFWIDATDGQVTGVVGLTDSGYCLVQCPGGIDWAAVRAMLGARPVIGLNGASAQVGPALAGLGLDRCAAALDRVEPLMVLAADDLEIPEGPGDLRAPTAADTDLLIGWRAAYTHEIMGIADPEQARRVAADQVPQIIAGGQMRLLAGKTGPLAMTAFNARTRESVQVGSVYTPPGLRSQGHARRAVALHLAEAVAEGIARAVLFAANTAARRAYEAIGFHQVGAYRMVILHEPATFDAAP